MAILCGSIIIYYTIHFISCFSFIGLTISIDLLLFLFRIRFASVHFWPPSPTSYSRSFCISFFHRNHGLFILFGFDLTCHSIYCNTLPGFSHTICNAPLFCIKPLVLITFFLVRLHARRRPAHIPTPSLPNAKRNK